MIGDLGKITEVTPQDHQHPFPVDIRMQRDTIANRNLINQYIRWEGMQVYVQATSTVYALLGGIADSNWVALSTLTATTGDVVLGTIINGSATATIQPGAVTYSKIQNVGASRLLGNPTGTIASVSEIVLGTGLSFSGNVLNATVTGSTSYGSLDQTLTVGNTSSQSLTAGTLISTGYVQGTYYRSSLSAAPGTPANGYFYYNSTSGLFQFYQGSAWIAFLSALTGDVVNTGSSTTIQPGVVTYSKFQNVAPISLVGNPTGTAASAQAITLSAGLSFVGSVLTVSYPVNNGITNLTGDVTATGPGSVISTIQPGVVTYAKIQNVTGVRLLGNTSASAGSIQEITVGSGLMLSAGSLTVSFPVNNGITSLTGDVAAMGPGAASSVIQPGVVTYAKVQNIGALKLLGNPTASSASITEITLGTNLTFSAGVLNATAGAGGITSLTGDVTGSGTGAVATSITAGSVTYAKIQNVAAGSLVGNPTASVASATNITLGANLVFTGTTLAVTGVVTSIPNLQQVTNVGGTTTGGITAGGLYAPLVQVAAQGAANDPYGVISVTLPSNSNAYSYYAMTRAGSVAWSMGIDTSNRLFLGLGGTDSGNNVTASEAFIFDSGSNLTLNGSGPTITMGGTSATQGHLVWSNSARGVYNHLQAYDDGVNNGTYLDCKYTFQLRNIAASPLFTVDTAGNGSFAGQLQVYGTITMSNSTTAEYLHVSGGSAAGSNGTSYQTWYNGGTRRAYMGFESIAVANFAFANEDNGVFYWRGTSDILNMKLDNNGVLTTTSSIYAGGNYYGTNIMMISRGGVAPDPYSPISVTMPNTYNYSYYSLTRSGLVAWNIGVDTSNNMFFGVGGTPSAGINTNSGNSVGFTSGGGIFAGYVNLTGGIQNTTYIQLQSAGAPGSVNNGEVYLNNSTGLWQFGQNGVWVGLGGGSVTHNYVQSNPSVGQITGSSGASLSSSPTMVGASTTMVAAGGKALIVFTGAILTNISDTIGFYIRYGTGSNPVSGAAVTGTTVGVEYPIVLSSSTTATPFSFSRIVTGLSSGTTYWFDLSARIVTGSSGGGLTVVMSNVSFSIAEF